MAWTTKQRQLAARAAGASGLDAAMRHVVLRQCPRAMYDRHGVASADPSSTSPKLTQADFEWFMAHVESWSGRITVGGADGRGFSPGYFAAKLDDPAHRQVHRILQIAAVLERSPANGGRPLLDGPAALATWIRKATHGETDQLDELTVTGATAVIQGLQAYARRHGVEL